MSKDVSEVTERARAVLAPLGNAEAERAVQAALDGFGDEAAMQLRRYELLIEKAPGRGQVPLRRVRVFVGDAASDVVHEIVVDAAGKVVSRSDGGEFPLTVDEIERAQEIAAQDERIARLLERPDVRAGAFQPQRHEARHRLVGLQYLTTDDPSAIEILATVVVDLATDGVASFEADDGAAGRPSRV
jgi:hypothetical protein